MAETSASGKSIEDLALKPEKGDEAWVAGWLLFANPEHGWVVKRMRVEHADAGIVSVSWDQEHGPWHGGKATFNYTEWRAGVRWGAVLAKLTG